MKRAWSVLRRGRWAGWILLWTMIGGLVWPRADWGVIRVRFINTQAVVKLGYGGYFWFDVVDTARRLWRRSQLAEIDPAPYRAYLTELAQRREVLTTGTDGMGAVRQRSQGKHVIYLQLESIAGMMIGARKDGKPVMPFLESLARENVYLANTWDNTASGRTTDAEFLVLTSEVPLPRPPVYVTQHLDKIPSMPRVMHQAGYRTVSMHGFNGAFWHRESAHRALGYDEMMFRKDLGPGDKIGWGLSDEALLRQAADLLAESSTPLFLHVITLTSHHPYTYLAEAQGRQPGRIEAEYLRSARYVDGAIRGFVERLRERGVLDHCLIAIYGDHDSAIDGDLQKYLDPAAPPEWTDTVPLVLVGFDRPAQKVTALAGLQDLPVMVLEELGIPVPLTFTGNGWGAWGRTVGGTHGAWQSTGKGLVPWPQVVDQEILTRLAINYPERLVSP